jgi:methylenetetrahydrofolate dehydrogenase (NADP+)/methenyltetrahydrofolate cyclohydrolase
LDGEALPREIEAGLAIRGAAPKERSNGELPMLATILVGGDPSSATYVKLKGNA